MYPTLLKLGGLEFHSYTVMMAAGLLVSVLLAVRENYKLDKPYPVTPIGGIWAFIGGLLGARAYWILQYREGFHKITDLYQVALLWTGGLVFYGGLIGGTLGVILYLRFAKVPVIPMADIAMPFVPLGHAIARVGCFLNGCCYGGRSGMPWAVCYPEHGYGLYEHQVREGVIGWGEGWTLPVHPTPLYACAGLLAIFFILRYAYKRKPPAGAVLLLYILLYSGLRFVTECFRGDTVRSFAGMTTSQAIAAVAFACAAICALILGFAYRSRGHASASASRARTTK